MSLGKKKSSFFLIEEKALGKNCVCELWFQVTVYVCIYTKMVNIQKDDESTFEETNIAEGRGEMCTVVEEKQPSH